MKRNDIVDLKTKTVDELTRMLVDLREEVLKTKTEAVLGRAKNTNLVKGKRKDIARVLTFLSMKSMIVETNAVQNGQTKEEQNG